jgi:hypothetical protein
MNKNLSERNVFCNHARVIFSLLAVILLAAHLLVLSGNSRAFAQSLPDLSGKWSGDDWGEVVLERIGPVSYAGTYSTTHGRDTGRITISYVAGKYEGKWWEGTFRLGTITLQASENGRVLTGTWSSSPASTINPGEPKSAALKWIKK